MAEGTKTRDIRVNNRKRVINLLFREGEMTKQDLTNRLEMSPPTVTVIIKELTEKGLIEKGEVLRSTGGRKPVTMKPVFDIKYSVGMQISLHEIRMVMVNLGADIVVRAKYQYGLRNDPEYWELVNRLLMDFIDANIVDRKKLLDVGISLHIPLNGGRVVCRDGNSVYQDLDLDQVSRNFSVPVAFYSSSKSAAIAQIWNQGEHESFVFVSVGSSVSGAIVQDGVVLDFYNLNGEFGRIVVREQKKQTCISDHCTITALCKRAGGLTRSEFYEAVRAGNEVCCEIWQNALQALADLLYNLRCIFGWKIVVGGSMCAFLEENREQLLRLLRAVDSRADDPADYLQISDLGEYGASVGAALFSVNKFLEFGYEDI